MTFNVPVISKSKVDKAGSIFTKPKAWREGADLENALEIINNFRSAHSMPLLVFRVDLSDRARRVDVTATVAQRLKRLPSIYAKLFRLSTMRLTQMEDIGGCRAVVRTVGMVRRLAKIYEKSKTKHKRLHIVDYLGLPRETGYRGIHLIYSYFSDSKPACNGLKIEIQLRSRQQHAWATAVETVDTFTTQGIKDGRGDPGWRRFFALMGTYIALDEKCNAVPDTPSDPKKLTSEIRRYEKELDVIQHLESYRATLQLEKDKVPSAEYYLVQLDSEHDETSVIGFKKEEIQQAQKLYLETEKSIAGNPKKEVVLVSVGSLDSLKKAYPNYFADTEVFLGIVREALS